MVRMPFSRDRSSDKGSGGGSERTEVGGIGGDVKPDSHVGVVGMLIGNRNLIDRAAVLAELNIISKTKILKPEEREQLADRILEGKQKLGKAKE